MFRGDYLDRRAFLRRSLVLALPAFLASCADIPSFGPPQPVFPTPTPTVPATATLPGQVATPATTGVLITDTGPRHARPTNIEVELRFDDVELQRQLQGLRAENASWLEADLGFGAWLTDQQFSDRLQDVERFYRLARAAGFQVAWFAPALEIISPNGAVGPSLGKTEPALLQIALDGRPHLIVGNAPGATRAGAADETAWLSPNSPWRDRYFGRIRDLARSGADAIWVDAAIYDAVAFEWYDLAPAARAAFRAEAGQDVPAAADWQNPIWRRWIAWRHRNLASFLIAATAMARSGSAQATTLARISTGDHYDATRLGLDGAYLRAEENLVPVWEMPVLSDTTGMRRARLDDWICLIAICKYARGASGTRPAWMIGYGVNDDDALQVFAEILAAGCVPYEAKSHERTTSIGPTIRRRLFTFTGLHAERLFDAKSLATIAVYHSSASRDYVAPSDGSGHFATTVAPPDVLDWWSTEESDSCYAKQWIGEYRGTVKALVLAHLPFDIVTSPGLRAADLAPYKALFLPDLEAVSDIEAGLLRDFVRAGGTAILTGPNPTGLNEVGDARPGYALADILGFDRPNRPAAPMERQVGNGRIVYLPDLVGVRYLRGNDEADRNTLLAAAQRAAPPIFVTDAPPTVHIETRDLRGNTVLQFTNFSGLTGDFAVKPATFAVALIPPAGKRAQSATLAALDAAAPADQPLGLGSDSAGRVTFGLTVAQYALIVVNWQ